MPTRILSITALLAATVFAQAPIITLDGNGTGRIYEGQGGVSAGASSRLVIDYPEPYRSQILDYLFKPNYGASLQHLKVEIGGNMNGTSGAEAAHMHTPTDQSYQRGYEWWLMEEAKKRNPDMIFSALEWGAPGWIGNGNFFSQDNIDYIINFIKGAQREHGITIHYVGIWNEAAYKISWIIDLKNALKAAGLSTQIIAADQGNSQIFLDMNKNSALREAVDVIGYHSPRGASLLYGPSADKRVWASELAVARPDWIGAKELAKLFNRGYVGSRITSNLLWNPVSAFYDLMLFPDSGLMYANSPWSGNYRVMPVLWATAHTTQFAQPGWQYLDQASGLMGVGSYVSLKNGSDFSIVIEAVDAGQNQTLTFKITGGLSTGPIHVWTSNATNQFIQANDIIPVNGSFTVTVAPGSIYSLTTTTGQFKGDVVPPPPTAFPFPYSDTFEGYPNDQTGRYLSAINGSFEIAPCVGGRAGSCLRQAAPMVPIIWPLVAAFEPATVLGSSSWTDYQVSVDVFFEQPGTVKLLSHMFGLAVNTGNVSGYQFYLDDAGNWRLCLGNNPCFKSGAVSLPPNSWHTLSLIWDRGQIQALINGVVVTSVSDGRAPAGYAGFGTGGWTLAQFDNFRVDTVPGVGPIVPQSQMTPIVSSQAPGFEAYKAIDGAKGTSWSSDFTCNGGCRALAPLPQSITLSLGGTYKVNKLRYLPRQDGASGGNITGYKVAVSTDGTTFTTVASGTWANNALEKAASFTPVDASHIQLESTAAAEGIARVAEIHVDYTPSGTVPENPFPSVSTLIPPSTNAGGSGFGLVVNGSNFVNGSVVRWNGVDRATTFVNPTTLTAAIPATDIALAGSANVTVFSSAPGGGVSNARTFTINSVTLPPTDPPPTDPPPTDPPPTDPPPDPSSATSFLTGYALNGPSLRNDFNGWVGMRLAIGSASLTVSSVGRICVAGNNQVHTVKFVNPATGADVPGGGALVDMAGCAPGQFKYAPLASPITLSAGQSYYLASQEFKGGDRWYEQDLVSSTAAGLVAQAVYSYNSPTWIQVAPLGTSYAPPNFLYVTGPDPLPGPTLYPLSTSVSPASSGGIGVAPPSASGSFAAGTSVQLTATPAVGCTFLNWSGALSGSANPQSVVMSAARSVTAHFQCSAPPPQPPQAGFLTGYALNGPGLRNDFNGWVGMKLTVSNGMDVESLGRICVAGNSGTHVVKFINATTRADVPGGSASINLAGCTPGQFVYSPVAPFPLVPGASYYLVSQETQGGDLWYNLGTVTSAGGAAVNSAVYSNASSWIVNGGPNMAYVPANFQFTSGPPDPNPPLITGFSGTALRNNFTGWVGTKFTVGATPRVVHVLGRLCVAGNAGLHGVKLVIPGVGLEVAGGSVTVNMAGCTPGQFVYAPLPNPLTLPAGVSYYLVTQETSGGDRWYELSSVSPGPGATLNSGVYSTITSWATIGSPNMSYGPPNLK